MNINSYGKVYRFGDKAMGKVLGETCFFQEKVDGSQISFGLINGVLEAKSKGQKLSLDDRSHSPADTMFTDGIATIKGLKNLIPDAIYRGEYLRKPRHNVLAYERIPKNHIILFDIQLPDRFMTPAEIADEAERIGLEAVPTFEVAELQGEEQIKKHLDKVSVLGGQKIEGVVVKPLKYVEAFDHRIAVKYVADEFKELMVGVRGRETAKDPVEDLVLSLACVPRWQKAAQHLRDEGKLTGSPRDIGALIKEAQADIREECLDNIKDTLWKHYQKRIMGGAVKGLAQWYLNELARDMNAEGGEASKPPEDRSSSQAL